MPKITAETPRKDIQIAGLVFKAPTPYAEGHPLTANEASALNQTYLENVGNNFRAKVTQAKRIAITGKAEPKPEEIKAVTDDQVKEFDEKLSKKEASFDISGLQSEFDTLVSEYEMGARRTSSVEVVDPVTKAANAIAKDRLKKALAKKGIKLNTVKKEWYDREVPKLIERDPKIRQTAERQVKLLQQAANESLDELDLDGISGDETEGQAKDETSEAVAAE